MKVLLVAALTLGSVSTFAGTEFTKCTAQDGTTIKVEKITGEYYQVYLNSSNNSTLSRVNYSGPTVIIRDGNRGNLVLSFNDVSGLGQGKIEGKLQVIDCDTSKL